MRCRKYLFIIIVLWCTNIIAQQTALPHSTPEAEGVSSKDITAFINAAEKSKTEFHSFVLLRHGKVIAEGWWNPYRADLKHTLYSCSKSFTATAIGFAVTEKLLSLDDKVISFFPNDLPDTVSDYLKELTVKDVLMMSDGQEPDPTFTAVRASPNWIKNFLATPMKHEPGTTFLYNSLGTYMLSAIVTKATGKQALDYLKPRLFEPLGITGEDWETDTKGNNTGGWGLRLKTEDMAKFAQLFLQKGNWNGKQILPASWIEEASTMKIMQDPDALQSKKDSSDWLQGYCYQMWRCRHNAFRGDGAFGQFMIVMPEQDAALAITAETADMQDEINLVWQYLLPAFKDGKLPVDAAAQKNLKNKIASLVLLPNTKNDVAAEKNISNKNFVFDANENHLKNMSFSFSKGLCHVKIATDTSDYNLDFATGKWQTSTTAKPGPNLLTGALENFSMLYPAKIAGSYSWQSNNTLQLKLRYIESPHSETYTCNFDNNQLALDIEKSHDFGKVKTQLKASSK